LIHGKVSSDGCDGDSDVCLFWWGLYNDAEWVGVGCAGTCVAGRDGVMGIGVSRCACG